MGGRHDHADSPSDGRLAAAAARGDRGALDTLLARHVDRIHALCRRILGNEHGALDATQEALIAITRGIRSFDGRSLFTTWCYRVTTNAALDEVRRRQRRPTPADVARAVRVEPAPDDRIADVLDVGALRRSRPSTGRPWRCAISQTSTTRRSQLCWECRPAPFAHGSRGAPRSPTSSGTVTARSNVVLTGRHEFSCRSPPRRRRRRAAERRPRRRLRSGRTRPRPRAGNRACGSKRPLGASSAAPLRRPRCDRRRRCPTTSANRCSLEPVFHAATMSSKCGARRARRRIATIAAAAAVIALVTALGASLASIRGGDNEDSTASKRSTSESVCETR